MQVAVGVLAWEYNRNSKKDESKIAREASFKKEISDSFAAYDQVRLNLLKLLSPYIPLHGFFCPSIPVPAFAVPHTYFKYSRMDCLL